MPTVDDPGVIIVEVEVPAVEVVVIDADGPPGQEGEQGQDGWSPILVVVNDDERRVFQVSNWIGGTGTPPAIGKYVGDTGLVDDINDAIDIRGAIGANGAQGEPGTPGAVIIGEGADILTGHGAPDDSIGAGKQLYLDEDSGDVYKKSDDGTTWGDPISNLRGPPGPRGTDGIIGGNGPAGPTGPNGWSPVLAAISDGTRRVLQVNDWVGGAGTKPTTGKYVGTSGLVTSIADALDIRGAAGAKGDTGTQGLLGPQGPQGNAGVAGSNGWLPVLASVFDSARVVFKIVDWVGGTGTKPDVDVYVGLTGLVSDIVDAVNVRGAAGAQGPAGAKGDPGNPGINGEDGATFFPAGAWDAGVTYSLRNMVSDAGSSYVAGGTTINERPSTHPDVWTLVASKGDEGDKGDQGIQGIQGIQGVKGDKGDKGDQGIQGDPGPDPINAADLGVYIGGTLADAQRLLKFNVVRGFTLPSGLTGSIFNASVAATASYVVTLKKNGSSIGTLTWAAAGTVPTKSFASAVSFVATDVFEITGAVTADATLADIALNFLGSR